MKKKFFTMLCCAMLFVCGVGIAVMTTGCGDKSYDMTKFAVTQNEFDYDGTSKYPVLSGVPEGLDYDFTYYTDEAYQNVDQLHQDARKYYVKISFTAEKGYKTPEDQFITMTINKSNFTNLDLQVNASYTVGEDTEKLIVNASENKDGSLFFVYSDTQYNVNFTVYDNQTETEKLDVQKDVKFYVDETLQEECSSILQQNGSSLYMVMTVSDKNHNPLQITKKVSIQDAVFELSTFEDLKLMRDHIYGNVAKKIPAYSLEARKQFKYVLMNDIDCEGQFWTPVQYILYGSGSNELNSHAFVGEFDGNEHTISNYKIGLESLNQTEANEATMGRQTLYLGFFGYVHDAKIHDLTLKNAEIKINKDDPNFALRQNVYVFAGHLAARISSGGSQGTGRTDINNITVENSVIDINAVRQNVGGFIGLETTGAALYANGVGIGWRDSLTIKNSKVYAYSTTTHEDIFVGGIVGETENEVGAGDTAWERLTYTKCLVSGLKIGFNVEDWLNAEGEDKLKYQLAEPKETEVEGADPIVAKYFVGTIAGRFYSTAGIGWTQLYPDNLTDYICKVENYLIAQTTASKTGYFGYASEGVAARDICENSLDASWNGGVNGVYYIDYSDSQCKKDNGGDGDPQLLDWMRAKY